jgi:hypothetical protein
MLKHPQILRLVLLLIAALGVAAGSKLYGEDPAGPVPAKVEGAGENAPFSLVMIKYRGGSWDPPGEMEQHAKELIPYFLKWLNSKKLVTAKEQTVVLRLADPRIANYPILFITGHFTAPISDLERQNLKAYLERGGFIFFDDCGGYISALQSLGSFAVQFHQVMLSIFPEGKFQALPADHEIYRVPFEFPKALPNFCGVDNNNGPDSPSKPRKGAGGEGFFYRGRMMAFFSDADIGCAWNVKDRESLRGKTPWWEDQPFKIGANVVLYALKHRGEKLSSDTVMVDGWKKFVDFMNLFAGAQRRVIRETEKLQSLNPQSDEWNKTLKEAGEFQKYLTGSGRVVFEQAGAEFGNTVSREMQLDLDEIRTHMDNAAQSLQKNDTAAALSEEQKALSGMTDILRAIQDTSASVD